MNWFNDKFFAEVSGPLTMERLYKRQMPVSAGGGSPDTEAIRALATTCAIIWPISAGWCARAIGSPATAELRRSGRGRAPVGGRLSGRCAVERRRSREDWYARVKSRPSFRPLLAETLAGHSAVEDYADLDF
jgi:glutathione S-transferase